MLSIINILFSMCPIVFLLFFSTCEQKLHGATPIEQLIRNNPTLVSLDQSLNQEYQKALEDSEDPEALRVSQRVWLQKNRNVCQDSSCLRAVYSERISWLRKVKRYVLVKHTDSDLGISFIYKSNRKIKTYKNTITISSKIQHKSDNEIITLKVIQADLDEAADESGAFSKDDEKTMFTLGIGQEEAHVIQGADWHGFIGTAEERVPNPNGGVSTAECGLYAVISNGIKSVIAEGMPNEESTEIIKSIRFIHNNLP